jgi:hypothetical protein
MHACAPAQPSAESSSVANQPPCTVPMRVEMRQLRGVPLEHRKPFVDVDDQ